MAAAPAPPWAPHRGGRSPRVRCGGRLRAAARSCLGAAASAAGSPGRAAHHPPPGPAAAPMSRGAAGWAGGAAAASGLVMSAAASARGPRRPRPMAGRGGSGPRRASQWAAALGGAASGRARPARGSRPSAGWRGRGRVAPTEPADPAQVTAREPPSRRARQVEAQEVAHRCPQHPRAHAASRPGGCLLQPHPSASQRQWSETPQRGAPSTPAPAEGLRVGSPHPQRRSLKGTPRGQGD